MKVQTFFMLMKLLQIENKSFNFLDNIILTLYTLEKNKNQFFSCSKIQSRH